MVKLNQESAGTNSVVKEPVNQEPERKLFANKKANIAIIVALVVMAVVFGGGWVYINFMMH